MRENGVDGAQGAHRFLNPYNFVRTLQVPDNPSPSLLGRCAPPPHDRYVGLSGRIACELTVETPLFIADTEGVRQDPQSKGHYHYQFFKLGGREAIPSTSLRGALRSVFEAVTNSCFPVFDPSRLDYRGGSAPAGMVPARVVKLDEKTGEATLELLDGAHGLPEGITLRRSSSSQSFPLIPSAPIPSYVPRVLIPKTREAFDPAKSQLPPGGAHTARVAALIGKGIRDKGRYREFVVSEVVLAQDHSSLVEDASHFKRFGYLLINGPNIENKHDERLFFRWDDNQGPVAPKVDAIPKSCIRTVTAASNAVREYNQHLADYRKRAEREVKKLTEKGWRLDGDSLPHPSRFARQEEQLGEGDLVYYIEDGPFGAPLLRPVSMPRLPYAKTRGELLDPQMHKCHEYDALCPACRVFGAVWEPPKAKGDRQQAQQSPVAYAGRVRLSHAELAGKPVAPKDVLLAILSTPKPTTTRFYLVEEPENGQEPRAHGWSEGRFIDRSDAQDPNRGRTDEQAGYSGPNRLRGRKVYRHQGKRLNEREYKRAYEVRDDQNRTLQGVLGKGTRFTFGVEFENLAPVELGALLWTLEMEGGWYHRLGLAKPLGFGSVRIRVCDDGTSLLAIPKRYGALARSRLPLTRKCRQNLTARFKTALADHFGAASFDDLGNVRDMQALLTEPQALPVHYPRSTALPRRDGKNYEWFVGNKRSGGQHGPRLELPTPGQEKEEGFDGLPLLDTRGDEVQQ